MKCLMQVLEQRIENVNIFARVEPKHKIRIVNALKILVKQLQWLEMV